MEVKLKKSAIIYYKNLFNADISREETMESIVPDALPDIARIIDVDASVVLRSKDAETGRATVGGVVNATVLYVPEGEDGVRRLEVKIPFTAVYENAGITSATRLTAALAIASMDGRMINPRKILVCVDVLTLLRGFEQEKTEVCGAGEDAGGAQLRDETCTFCAVADVREKTFVVSDEFTLPAAKPALAEIMKTGFYISAEDVKTVGSKLIVRGTVFMNVTYRPREGGLAVADFSTAFSQIVEMENADDPAFALQIMPTGAYVEAVDSSSQGISLELHGVIQAVMSRKFTVDYIGDAYLNGFDVEVASGELAFDSVEKEAVLREQLRTVLETPVPVRSVLLTTVSVGRAERTAEEMGCHFTAPMSVNCVYLSEDGRILNASAKENISVSWEQPCGEVLYSAVASCGEIFAVPDANGIDLRVAVNFAVGGRARSKITAVSGISWDESAPKDLSGRPSLIVCRVGAGDTLWSLAKKYGSSASAISEANGLESGEITGRQLIIPKWK